jgi:hypothetical protein
MGEDELALVSFKRASKMNRKFKAAGKAYMDTRRRMQANALMIKTEQEQARRLPPPGPLAPWPALCLDRGRAGHRPTGGRTAASGCAQGRFRSRSTSPDR